PNVKIIGCQPQQNHLIQGWRNFEESAKPDLFLKREHVVDDWISVDNNEAFSVVKEVFEKDRLLISPSSAAVYACMKKYPIEDNACVVGIFADDGRKFKSVYVTQNILSESEFDNILKDAKCMSELAY
ncbi:MAG: cysteine synthase family protein, partial [Nitrosopumilus sp.]